MAKGGAPSGCALIFIGLIFLAVIAWLFKIAVILLGVVAIGLGSVGALLVVFAVWAARVSRRRVTEEGLLLDASIADLTSRSHARLAVEMTAWDRLQSNRGLGTTLEKAYFHGEVNAETQDLFTSVNGLMEKAEKLRQQDVSSQSRRTRIRVAAQIDETWIELERKRKSVQK
ncbi:hypothetical protein [Corynebacterium sputi]|uniref:hypothetical protein n=1 Tax=Corynebacterium sputi TaxID=489915 RepID=UPI000411790C|nr:hypothetical protein [Corynebacterium sputi]